MSLQPLALFAAAVLSLATVTPAAAQDLFNPSTWFTPGYSAPRHYDGYGYPRSSFSTGYGPAAGYYGGVSNCPNGNCYRPTTVGCPNGNCGVSTGYCPGGNCGVNSGFGDSSGYGINGNCANGSCNVPNSWGRSTVPNGWSTSGAPRVPVVNGRPTAAPVPYVSQGARPAMMDRNVKPAGFDDEWTVTRGPRTSDFRSQDSRSFETNRSPFYP